MRRVKEGCGISTEGPAPSYARRRVNVSPAQRASPIEAGGRRRQPAQRASPNEAGGKRGVPSSSRYAEVRRGMVVADWSPCGCGSVFALAGYAGTGWRASTRAGARPPPPLRSGGGGRTRPAGRRSLFSVFVLRLRRDTLHVGDASFEFADAELKAGDLLDPPKGRFTPIQAGRPACLRASASAGYGGHAG